MGLSVCVTDDDYEAWRQVRIAVVPGERCDTVAEMRAQDSTDRLIVLATMDGAVVGSGVTTGRIQLAEGSLRLGCDPSSGAEAWVLRSCECSARTS